MKYAGKVILRVVLNIFCIYILIPGVGYFGERIEASILLLVIPVILLYFFNFVVNRKAALKLSRGMSPFTVSIAFLVISLYYDWKMRMIIIMEKARGIEGTSWKELKYEFLTLGFGALLLGSLFLNSLYFIFVKMREREESNESDRENGEQIKSEEGKA